MNLYKFSDFVNEKLDMSNVEDVHSTLSGEYKSKKYIVKSGIKNIGIVSAITAGGYGIYKLIKALVNSLKSDETKLKQLESELHTSSDKRKITIKQDILNLKKRIGAKKKKLIEKKKEASKKHKNESLDFEIDSLLLENYIFIQEDFEMFEKEDSKKAFVNKETGETAREAIGKGKTLKSIGIDHNDIKIPKEELVDKNGRKMSKWQHSFKKCLKVFGIKKLGLLNGMEEFKNFFKTVKQIYKES